MFKDFCCSQENIDVLQDSTTCAAFSKRRPTNKGSNYDPPQLGEE